MLNRKFKLIKKFPGSPNVGTEVKFQKGIGFSNTYFSNTSGHSYWYHPEDVENNPEFWEEITEKNWEILSFNCLTGNKSDVGQLFTRIDNTDNFRWDTVIFPISYILRKLWNPLKGGYVIHSVKRLSDGEIFSIGDKIKSEPFVTRRGFTVIDEIYYNEHKQLSYKTCKGEVPRTFVFCEDTVHYKEVPLFITEDGVEIFEGDKFYPVCIEEGYGYKPFEFIPQRWSSVPSAPWFRYFSTEQAAKQYIEDNKPIYSKKQTIQMIRDFDWDVNDFEGLDSIYKKYLI